MAVTSKAQNLSKERVAKVFADYGYKPTENDLIYWASKPDSAYATLVSNLSVRMKKENDIKMKGDIEKFKNVNKDENSPTGVAKENIQGTSGTVTSQIGGKTKNYPLGEYSLVKFDNSPTVFLVDFKNKELRPFLSEEAFNTSYPHPEEAWKSIHVLPSQEHINPLGALGDFNLLSTEYGVTNNGVFMKDPDYRLNNVKKKYNQPEVSIDEFNNNKNKLFYILDAFGKNNKSKIDQAFLNKQLSNPELMAFYGNAITYGGYTLNDIYKDLKKREMQGAGDKSYENVKYIDDMLPKNQYAVTPAGKFADQDLRISVPTEFVADNPKLWNMPITQVPQDAFRNMNQELDLTSKKNLDEASKIQSAFHDVLQAKLTATTEAQKEYADYQYDQLVDNIEKQYGIKLSSNASQAWNQIENLTSQATEAGLGETGIAQEEIDQYLKDVRRQGAQLREQKLTEEEKQQADYIRRFGSSEQIKKLDDEDKAKGVPQDQWRSVKWGLKPGQDLLNSVSAEALKKKFPNITDEEINDYRNQIIDQYGNFRSDLYQKQYEQIYRVRQGQTLEQRFNESLADYQKRMQAQRLLDEEAKRMEEFTKRQDDFSKKPIVPEAPIKEQEGKPVEPEKKEPPKPGVGDVYGPKMPGTWTPPSGKKHILSPDKMGNYENIEKDPYSNKLYGTPKMITGYKDGKPVQVPKGEYTPGVSLIPPKPSQPQTQPTVTTKPIIQQSKPQEMITGYKDGKAIQVPKGQYVPGVSLTPPPQQQKQKMITGYKDGKAIQVPKGVYTPGVSLTPQKSVQPSVPSIPKPIPQKLKWTPPQGTQHILTPGDIPKYKNVVKDPGSNKMYGKLK